MPDRASKSAQDDGDDDQGARITAAVVVRGLSFDHLATLKAVAETGSFRRAAERRLISQPAVSQRIRQLERLVGHQLFDRQRGTSPALTATGELMVALADDVLQKLDEFCNGARDLSVNPTTGGSITVAAGASYIKYGLLNAAAACAQRYPDIAVRFQRQLTADAVMESIVQGNADIGIYPGVVPANKVRSFPLLTESLRLVAPRRHGVTTVKGPQRIAELSKASFAVSCVGAHSRQVIEAWARRNAITLSIRVEADNLDTLKEAVVQGFALAVLPEFAITEELESGILVNVDVPGLPAERRVSVIARANRPLLGTEEAFIETLRSMSRS